MSVTQWEWYNGAPTTLIHDRQPFGAKAASTLRGETFPNHNHLQGISEFVIHLQIYTLNSILCETHQGT